MTSLGRAKRARQSRSEQISDSAARQSGMTRSRRPFATSSSGQRRAARHRADRSGPAPAARRRPRRSWRRCRCTAPAAAPPARRRFRRRRDAALCGSPDWRQRRRRKPARSECRSRSRNMRKPERSRSLTTSTTACWNEAHRSATSWSVSGAIFSASSRNAVFSPDSEKSASRASAHRPRQRKARGVAARGFPLDQRAARIAEAEQFRRLVEGLADRIVERAAKPQIVADPAHAENLGMAAGGEKQAITETASRRSAAR